MKFELKTTLYQIMVMEIALVKLKLILNYLKKQKNGGYNTNPLMIALSPMLSMVRYAIESNVQSVKR